MTLLTTVLSKTKEEGGIGKLAGIFGVGFFPPHGQNTIDDVVEPTDERIFTARQQSQGGGSEFLYVLGITT